MRIFCPQCGTENDTEKVNFCPNCGFNISTIVIKPAQPATPNVPVPPVQTPQPVQPIVVPVAQQPAPVCAPSEPITAQAPIQAPVQAPVQPVSQPTPQPAAPAVTEYESFVTMSSPEEENTIPVCEPDSDGAYTPVPQPVPTALPDTSADGIYAPVPSQNGQTAYRSVNDGQFPAEMYAEPAGGKNKKKQKKEKKQNPNGKKHRVPWIFRFIFANIIIFGVLFFIWFAAGNYVTLYLHSEDVVETLNSGSLDLDGTQNAYDELPNYIKDMMSDEHFNSDYGPITKTVLPYIHAERKSINGLFGASSVTYNITAPDLEFWLLSIDPASVTDENQLLAMLEQYVVDAPRCTSTVEIQYARKHIFSIDWKGNYYTPEFTDAVCGGFNSGYNIIYQRAMDELNEAMFGKAEQQ